MLTPKDIQEKHFHDSFRGYSHEEVDLFLDEVAEAFQRLHRENQTYQSRVAELQQRLARAGDTTQAAPAPEAAPVAGEKDVAISESMLRRMLVIAQETADNAVREARQKAKELVEQAEARGREIESQAQSRAEQMLAGARGELQDLEGATKQRRADLKAATDALNRFDNDYRNQFRAFIEAQLQTLDGLPRSAEAVPDSSNQPEPQPEHQPDEIDIFAEDVPSQEISAAPEAGAPAGTAEGGGEDLGDVPGEQTGDQADEEVKQDQVKQDRGRRKRRGDSGDDREEDALIRELFWGED